MKPSIHEYRDGNRILIASVTEDGRIWFSVRRDPDDGLVPQGAAVTSRVLRELADIADGLLPSVTTLGPEEIAKADRAEGWRLGQESMRERCGAFVRDRHYAVIAADLRGLPIVSSPPTPDAATTTKQGDGR